MSSPGHLSGQLASLRFAAAAVVIIKKVNNFLIAAGAAIAASPQTILWFPFYLRELILFLLDNETST